MINNDKLEDLGRMYRLFNLVPDGPRQLKACLCQYLEHLGKTINDEDTSISSRPNTSDDKSKSSSRSTSPIIWVQAMISLKDQFDNFLQVCFDNDKQFETDLNTSFQNVINQHEKAPEYTSLFIDENLRKGLKGVNDTL